MRVVTRHFSGESPRTRAHELPEALAQIAQDVIVYKGAVEPLKSPVTVNTLFFSGVVSGIGFDQMATLFRLWDDTTLEDRYWIFGREIDDVIQDIGTDTRNRSIVFGDRNFYIFRVNDFPAADPAGSPFPTGAIEPVAAAALTVPRPSAPVLALVGSPSNATVPEELIAVVSAVQISTGREGPPSLISNSVNWNPGQLLQITVPAQTNWGVGIEPGYTYRIYLSSTDSTGNASFRFFFEGPLNADPFTQTVSAGLVFDPTTLQEELPSVIADIPPADLHSVVMHPNGFVVGLSGYKLVRSEVFEPHNYPQDYRDPIKHFPIALGLIGQSIIIGTKETTFLASGQDPLNISIVELEGNMPCLSKLSMKTVMGGVVYASPDGLAMVTSNGNLTNFTQDIFTRDQWQSFNPASMHAAVQDNRYYCFYDNGTVRGALIFDNGSNGVTLTRTSQHFSATYSDPLFDQMYGVDVVQDGGSFSGFVAKWNAGSVLQFLWKSKEHRMERETCMGAARVEADAYPVTFKFFADGALIHTQTAVDNRAFRMPPVRGRYFTFQVEAMQTVTGVTFANTLAECAG